VPVRESSRRSSKEMPCFRRFSVAFFGSHSKFTGEFT
jgi:hypothetical protein